ncbi:MAG: hypothetical protein IJO53_13135, partial [Clostridia bacterium]|nr:hypothetical protein [Clostridia bacterium]
LGSSATLLAGGVTAANALNGNPLSRQELVELCNEIEGHPDNVAPAVLGGMCVSFVSMIFILCFGIRKQQPIIITNASAKGGTMMFMNSPVGMEYFEYKYRF